jgi:twitching motility protein PilJ
MSFAENLKRRSADRAPAQPALPAEPTIALPLLGQRRAVQQRRVLRAMLIAALLVLVGLLIVPLSRANLGPSELAALAGLSLIALLAVAGLTSVQRQEQQHCQQLAEHLEHAAQHQQQTVSDMGLAQERAYQRLLDELQAAATGDLRQLTTAADDDSTGGLASAMNATLHEFRTLVGSVQTSVARVADTTANVNTTTAELLVTSAGQLREIRETGRSVLDMALRMNEVSMRAQESADVARQSCLAADAGRTAVQNAVSGMDGLREQIQDTAKRLKRLGESSQEIGEITELISDITEQTNVLALNAAIQAASAGDAGRGFSVVAEEVQRLAERSADATRQIATLVKSLQSNTQDAVAAMARSTQGVVAGARLTDTAGASLTEIDQVSRRLSELIAQICSATARESELANGVADSIQHIFAVTEQTGDGTRATAQQMRELSQMAQTLQQSVARFRI